jgi:hypothetical protein
MNYLHDESHNRLRGENLSTAMRAYNWISLYHQRDYAALAASVKVWCFCFVIVAVAQCSVFSSTHYVTISGASRLLQS